MESVDQSAANLSQMDLNDDETEQVVQLDIPERIQMFEKINGSSLDEKAIHDESIWISDQLGKEPLFSNTPGFVGSLRPDDIERFLSLHYVEKLDIPFIATYRKEQCTSLLQDPDFFVVDGEYLKYFLLNKGCRVMKHKVLWAIQELHREWLFLRKQQQECDLKKQQASDLCCHFVNDLEKLAHQFGCSFKEFKFPVSEEKGWWEDIDETPEETASKFTNSEISQFDVLDEARQMVAMKISCESAVRDFVRRKFLNLLQVSTSPASPGTEIDALSKLKIFQKPWYTVDEEDWLLIQKQEKSNLLQVTFKLPQEEQTTLISVLNEYSLKAVSKSVQLWNEQRNLIFSDAVSTHLLAFMENEARTMLTTRAKKWLKSVYGNSLWNKVSVGPWSPKRSASTVSLPLRPPQSHRNPVMVPWSERKTTLTNFKPKVMACCWTCSQTPLFVILDVFGEVLDVLFTPIYIDYSGETDPSPERRKKNVAAEGAFKQKFLADLKIFMEEHKPHITILEAHYLSYNLKENIGWIKSLNEPLNVIYGEESLVHLDAHCEISRNDMPHVRKYAGISSSSQLTDVSEKLEGEWIGTFKRAVILGRYLQNPLVMVATLCGSKREVLSWDLCPLQECLTSDEKYSVIEQVMVDVTNQVGIDINLAIKHKRLFAPLQFVSGLGPRKAKFLQQSLEEARKIRSREALKAHGLGEKVFFNAVGFLRVQDDERQPGMGCTRIHPESYELSEEVEKFIHNVVQLRRMCLEKHAVRTGRQSKALTLHDIRRELLLGFYDWRKKHTKSEPSDREDEQVKTIGRPIPPSSSV